MEKQSSVEARTAEFYPDGDPNVEPVEFSAIKTASKYEFIHVENGDIISMDEVAGVLNEGANTPGADVQLVVKCKDGSRHVVERGSVSQITEWKERFAEAFYVFGLSPDEYDDDLEVEETVTVEIDS